MEENDVLNESTETQESTEVVDDTEIVDSTNEAVAEDTEIPEEGTEVTETESESNGVDEKLGAAASGESTQEDVQIEYVISYDEMQAAVKSAMEEYYSANAVQVIDVGSDAGIHKTLDELTFTEVCLVIIVLILLGRSILHIIGGKAWNR